MAVAAAFLAMGYALKPLEGSDVLVILLEYNIAAAEDLKEIGVSTRAIYPRSKIPSLPASPMALRSGSLLRLSLEKNRLIALLTNVICYPLAKTVKHISCTNPMLLSAEETSSQNQCPTID